MRERRGPPLAALSHMQKRTQQRRRRRLASVVRNVCCAMYLWKSTQHRPVFGCPARGVLAFCTTHASR